MLHTHWSAEAWSQVRVECRRALALRSEIRRAGGSTDRRPVTIAHPDGMRPATFNVSSQTPARGVRDTFLGVMLSENLLRQTALACYHNAEALHDEARLRTEHGHAARTVALAIFGLEEFAKAIVYTMGALMPGQRCPTRQAQAPGGE
jgi:AbiV